MKQALFLCAVGISLGVSVGYLWLGEAESLGVRRAGSGTPGVVPAAAQGTVSRRLAASAAQHNTLQAGENQVPAASSGLTRATLWGTIKDEAGDVITGQSLKLYSASLNQQQTATSNAYGEFVFNGITPTSDYRLSVTPRDMYYRYEDTITIDDHQINTVIVLRKLPLGLLTGRVVDVAGDPVPRLGLVIKSLSKPRWTSNVTADENGQFALNNVPQGKLEVSSRASHLLQTTGIQFTSGSEHLLKVTGLEFVVGQNLAFDIVVDSGPYSIGGRVQDPYGEPLMGVNVLLDWRHSKGALRSVSARRTTTDFNGEFSIDRVGPGEHDLIISYGGIGAERLRVNVGYDFGQIEAVLAASN